MTNWSCSLGSIRALHWIFFHVTRVSFIKSQLQPLDGSGVVRVLKSSSFSYLLSCHVCPLVPACSHLCNSLTLTTSSPSAPSLCLAKCYFLVQVLKKRESEKRTELKTKSWEGLHLLKHEYWEWLRWHPQSVTGQICKELQAEGDVQQRQGYREIMSPRIGIWTTERLSSGEH